MENKKMLKIKELAEVLNISTKKAYRIVAQPDFPSIKIGREYFVPTDMLEKWITTYVGKEYKLI